MPASGLVVGVRRETSPQWKNTIALIDAMLDAGNGSFKIEQISFSEKFSAKSGALVTEMRLLFPALFSPQYVRYMHWRIDRWREA